MVIIVDMVDVAPKNNLLETSEPDINIGGQSYMATAQLRIDHKLVEKAKITYVTKLQKDYQNNNNLATEIFQFFIEANQEKVAGRKAG